MPKTKSIYNKTNFHIIIHCLVWLILLGFPLLFFIYFENWSFHKYMHYLIPMTFAMSAFYINFIYFVPKFLFNKKSWHFFLANIIFALAVVLIMEFIQKNYLLGYSDIPKDAPKPPKFFFYMRNVISLAFMTGISVAIKMTNRWYKAEAERRELEKNHLESELSHLKSQLNPHFLFNTLNNIYSLIAINQDNAQGAVHQLSKLLRYVLYDSNLDKVPIEKEVALLKNYIELMSLRLPKHVKVETHFAIGRDVDIAPLLFIALIENAFKHGVHPSKVSFINIKIESNDNKSVLCMVENSNHPKTNNDKSGSGIGLGNLKKRLDLIYPLNHVLITELRSDSFYAELKINC